jgi:hypothetical protein
MATSLGGGEGLNSKPKWGNIFYLAYYNQTNYVIADLLSPQFGPY